MVDKRSIKDIIEPTLLEITPEQVNDFDWIFLFKDRVLVDVNVRVGTKFLEIEE